MRQPRFFFHFTTGQRKGIMALFMLIILLQAAYYMVMWFDLTEPVPPSGEEKEWLALQSGIDSAKTAKNRRRDTIYPFDPNYVSDYKGYILRLSVAQIDRLHEYRAKGKFISSAAGFQQVTGVHDTVLQRLEPYLRFSGRAKSSGKNVPQHAERQHAARELPPVIDINRATEQDLARVYGIGPAYAGAILRRRGQLGAFVSMEQMHDFYGFPPKAIAGLKERFAVEGQPHPIKLNINNASLQQLSRFPYFNRELARAVITARSMEGRISGIDELLEIPGFPVDKINIIALYLEF